MRSRLARGALCAALAVSMFAPDASAITLARVTRHGYVMIDEPGADAPYNGVIPTSNNIVLLRLLADTTTAIDAAGGAHVDYVAFLQRARDASIISFYVAIANDITGLAIPGSTSAHRETFDRNPTIGTAFPVKGLVFLNDVGLYRIGALASFARRFLCPQEFSHATSAYIRVPPYPGADTPDGGSDAGDAATPLPVPTNSLLGRVGSHWSFFLNTGGTPMEGNHWVEDSPGEFHTEALSGLFSPLDLYLMGLVPPSAVPPFWLIAEPDVMEQRDDDGIAITRQSDPLLSMRTITAHGRRVTFTIDDVIRANGPRVPAYRDPDAGGPSPDVRVAWVLLATADTATDLLASQFDTAIEACSTGYAGATGDRAHLLALLPPDDAGDDAGDDDATTDAAPDDAPRPDDRPAPRDVTVAGPSSPPSSGCQCASSPVGAPRGAGLVALGLTCLMGSRRRRKSYHRSDSEIAFTRCASPSPSSH